MCLFLASCKVDYSAIRVAPPNEPVAHLVAGLSRLNGAPVLILAINGKKPGALLGREVQIAAGRNTVKMKYWDGWVTSEVDFAHDFGAGAYYIFTQVSADAFQVFMCRAQKDLQERLKNVNPQPAPACDAVRRKQSAAL
ncbi:hypothetical protein [Stenotrophomonas sp. PD6]|uniref:hypothetical protein n=1 Tax=Stenotrophomonas sp. PD6 TaxID=3368612 RepID=UPI003BA0E90D